MKIDPQYIPCAIFVGVVTIVRLIYGFCESIRHARTLVQAVREGKIDAWPR